MRRLIALIVLPAVTAGAAFAQAPTSETAASALRGCTYDTCALRLSSRVFGGIGVQKGLDGPRTKFGFAGGGLVRAVQAVPAAAAVADIAHRQFRTGAIVSLIGGVAGAVLLSSGLNTDIRSSTRNKLLAGTLVSAGFSVFGGIQLTRGTERFSRAVWLYNREIPR